jgi:ketosteroid isomerase-like protein
MSQENVESMHRSVDAFARRDRAGWLELCDPDAAHGFFKDLAETLGPGEALIEDLIDAGDRIVSRFRVRVHGRRSDIEQETVLSTIHTFRRGKVIMIEFFLDHEEALEATGLSE